MDRRELSALRGRSWVRGYLAAQLLFWMGYGVYYTYSRMYIEETRGQDYAFASLLAAAEVTPLLFSVALGFLADRLGRRRVILLGLGEALATAAMGLVPLSLLPLLSGLAALVYSIAYSALFGAMLAGVSGSGYLYSVIAAAGSVGWGLGGLVAGALHGLGPMAEFGFAGLLMGLGYLSAYASTTAELEATERPGIRDVASSLGRIVPLFASITLGGAGLNLFFTSSSLKLKAEIEDPLLYGIVFSTITALLSAGVRPLAGRISDRVGHVNLLALATALYIPLAYGILVTHGLALALLWIIPLFPFRDVALSMSVSVSLPRSLQATAAGVIAFSSSIGGLLVLTAYPVIKGKGLENVFAITISMLVLSLICLIPYLRRGLRR